MTTDAFWGRTALGLALSATIGLLAYRAGALAGSGAAGAVLLGTLILGFGGWPWAILLVAFFVSSSLLSMAGRSRKRRLLGEAAKGSRRDLAQTLANAGVAGLLALAAGLMGNGARLYPVMALAYAGALAAANADTWATEIGVLAAQPPRLITTGARVAPGVSGGVTLAGTLAALAGAAFIGGIAALLPGWDLAALAAPGWAWVAIAAAAGLAGALFDSLLGATLQATYWCPACEKQTEQPVHRCGQTTQLVRGRRWLDNDGVNLLATACGAVVASVLALALV